MQRNRLNLATALVALSGTFLANAATVQNYEQTFDKVVVQPSGTCLIPYWSRYTPSAYASRTFSNPQENGQDGKGYLLAGSSYSSDPDFIISPKVSGTVEFYAYAQAASGWYTPAGVVSVYPMTKTESGWSYGNPLELPTTIADSWTKVTINLEEPTYLGFTMKSGAIDNFTASTAELEETVGLTITSACANKGVINTNLDLDRKTSFQLPIAVTNVGTSVLSPSDYSFEVYASSDYYGNESFKVGDAPSLPDYIESYGTATGNLDITIQFPEGTDFDTAYYLRLKETASGTEIKIQEMDEYWGTPNDFNEKFVPYLPKLQYTYLQGEKPYNADSAISLGQAVAGENTIFNLTLLNGAGKAPLTVTGLTLEGDPFSYDGETAFTLAAGETKVLPIKVTAPETGAIEGTLKVTSEELGEISQTLTAVVRPGDVHVMDFNDGEIPSGMILGTSWSIEDTPGQIARVEGDKSLSQTGYMSTEVITPKLHFNEDEAIYFDVASKSGSGEMKVYTSTDRNEWEQVLSITRYSDADIQLPTNNATNAWGSICYPISAFAQVAAGDIYVKFEGYGVLLDNIAGGEVIITPVDMYLTGSDLPKAAVVNNKIYASMSARNLGNDIEEDSYTVSLLIDGEAVKEAETPAIEAGEAVTFEFEYAPHEAGIYTAQIIFKLDDYELATPEATIDVAPETASEIYQIGTYGDYWYNHPLKSFTDMNYQSEAIYSKSEIQGTSVDVEEPTKLAPGDMISYIAWMGKAYSEYQDTLKGKIYLSETEDEKPGATFADVNDMTLVFDGLIKFDRTMVSEWGHFATAQLQTPYEYQGGNLRLTVIVEPEELEVGYNNLFGTDTRYTEHCIYTNGPTEISRSQLPVIYLGAQMSVPMLYGNVVSSNGSNPIANATVSIEVDHIRYKAVTDESGDYSMDIYQYENPFTLTATADSHYDYTHAEPVEITADGKNLNLQLEYNASVVSNVAATTGLSARGLAGAIEISANGADVRVYDTTGRQVAFIPALDGKKVISGLQKGIYVVNSLKVLVK